MLAAWQASPASNGGRGLKRHLDGHRPSRRDASPASNGGRGLKPEPERKDLIDRAEAGEQVSARPAAPKTNAAETLATDLHAALRLAMAKHSCRAVVPFGEMVEHAYLEMDDQQRKVFEEMRDAVMTVFEFVVSPG